MLCLMIFIRHILKVLFPVVKSSPVFMVNDLPGWCVHDLPVHAYPVDLAIGGNFPGCVRQSMLFDNVPFMLLEVFKIIDVNDRGCPWVNFNQCKVIKFC